MIAYTAENITCSCSLLSGDRRRLSNNSSTGVPSGEVKVDYVSMLGAVTGNFESTVLSAGDLNASMVARGWQAMVTIGTLFGGIIIAMVMSHFADKKNQRIESFEEKLKQSKHLALFPKGRTLTRQQGSNNLNIMRLAAESLPDILGSKSFTSKIKNEIKRHHKFFAVVYHYSHKLPRVLRVVSLATNIIIMLFVQSLTYNLTNGDDGSCEQLKTQSSCLQPRSAYATGQSKCYWTPSTTGDGESGSCAYLQPDNSVEVILFVAIFSAIISTPFALLADQIIVKILAAPLLNTKRSKIAIYKQQNNFDPNASAMITNTNNHRHKLTTRSWKKVHSRIVQTKFDHLLQHLRKYHENLTDPMAKKEFEGNSLSCLLLSLILIIWLSFFSFVV
jgi:hypothetical protein